MENERKNIVITLATNDDSKLLVLSNFSGNQRDPYSCDIQLRSGPFGFDGVFCFDNYSEFTASVEQMAETMIGRAVLKEDFKDQSINIDISRLGHVTVSGVISQYSDPTQTLSFGFKTDQTCLTPFGKDLRKILE